MRITFEGRFGVAVCMCAWDGGGLERSLGVGQAGPVQPMERHAQHF